MRSSRAAAAAAVFALCALTAGHAGANPADEKADESNLTIGVGIMCNTPEQMQRLVGLRNDGTEVNRALTAVNDEAGDPRACGIAAVAFMSDRIVEMKNVQGKLVRIMRINVLAAFDGERWSRIPMMTQYALIEPEGETI